MFHSKGKCTSPYDQQKFMPLPRNPAGASSPWQLRMTRLTADSTLTSVQNDTYLSSYTEVINTKFTYPNTAYIGMVQTYKATGLASARSAVATATLSKAGP